MDMSPSSEPREIGSEVVGTPIGATGGNLLGYNFGGDGNTTTVLGGLLGSGSGYWRGHRADEGLKRAQSASLEIASLEAQSKLGLEQPKLFARSLTVGTEKVAFFERLETHLPRAPIDLHSGDVSVILRKLGAFAARANETVLVEAPNEIAHAFILREIRLGAGAVPLNIVSIDGAEPKVIVGQRGP
ncbi:MAG: hypothetical protein ABIU95_03535 [Burkholderiales bacterium]